MFHHLHKSAIVILCLYAFYILSQGAEEWQVIFFLASAIYVAGAVFYLLFASGRQQPWAEVPLAYQPQMDDTTSQEITHSYGQEIDEVEDEN